MLYKIENQNKPVTNEKNSPEKKEKAEIVKPKKNLSISNENNFNIKETEKEKNSVKDSVKDSNKDSNNNKTINNENKDKDEAKIYSMLSDLNELSSVNNKVNFDKNLYKKPNIYYPKPHDNFIIPPVNKDYKSNNTNDYVHRARSFQEVINERIKFENEKKNPNINIIMQKNPQKSYENKMDDFFVQSTLNNFKLQQRIKNNLKAFYDIGFPEELKSTDINSEF